MLTLAAFCALLGLLIGSFLNVVVHRVPRGESVVSPPSACPSCSNAIRPRDNVPVAGWLLLKGKCRDCQHPISARYLQGATISYQQDNMLAGAFKIDNPNAVSSCGCGHSFRAKNEAASSEYDGYDEGYAGGGCGSCGHG